MPVLAAMKRSFGNLRFFLAFGLFLAALNPMAALGQGLGPRLLERPDRIRRQDDRYPLFTADVNLVLVPVTVTDPLGRVVNGLERGSFKVFEEKTPREIIAFSSQDTPCSVGLLFDVSGSMRDKISKARLAARAFFDTANPEDEFFLMTFADRPELKTDFTSDFTRIQNSLAFAEAKGSTALIDAVYLGLSQMRLARTQRKALLIVSDGGDNHSRHSQRELKPVALEADVQIYAIGIHDRPRAAEEMSGRFLLENLAEATGGRHFMIRDINELSDVAARIGAALHNQYLIGFYPPDNIPAGEWRRIQVRVETPKGLPSLRAYARSGYFTPGQ